MAKKNLTKKQINILYECWKQGNTYKERVILAEKLLPKVPSMLALKTMRKLAKTDPKWVGWTTRQSNKIEKEKQRKKLEREKKKAEKEKRRIAREKRKEKQLQRAKEKSIRDNISKNLHSDHTEILSREIDVKFFFCTNLGQYINTISCIFRAFDGDIQLSGMCEKCNKMDKYIPTLQDIIKRSENGRQKGTKRHKTGGRRGKSKKKTQTKAAKKRKTRKSNSKCQSEIA